MSFVEDATSGPTTPQKSSGFRKGGYFAYTPWSFVTITVFNAVLALVFLALGLPLIAAIAVVIKLKNQGPILYKGTRLGLSKRPFAMYKFRTLPVGAQKQVGTDVLRPGHFRLSRFSRFLRDTRLDELPQLLNILKGDMDFIGPRPVRPEVYDDIAGTMSKYDMRFGVRPGLIGYAQLFTPHSTPKRLRALIDNKFVSRERKLSWDIMIILYTVWVLSLTTLRKGFGHLTDLTRSEVFRYYTHTRVFDRVRADGAYVVIRDGEGNVLEQDAYLVDINETHFKVLSARDLSDGEYVFVLHRKVRRGGRHRRKRSVCRGRVFKTLQWSGRFKHAYVVQYTPLTDLNHYMVDQYFLRKSIA